MHNIFNLRDTWILWNVHRAGTFIIKWNWINFRTHSSQDDRKTCIFEYGCISLLYGHFDTYCILLFQLSIYQHTFMYTSSSSPSSSVMTLWSHV